MICTDASGQANCEYGKTCNHVLALDTVLLGDERLTSHPPEGGELATLCEREDATD